MLVNAVRAFGSYSVDLGKRRFIPIAIILLTGFAGFFILSSRQEIAEGIGLISRISPVWILILAGLQVTVLLTAGLSYTIILQRQGHRVGLLQLVEIHLRRILVGTVTPVGGPASVYVLVRELRHHGVSDSNSLVLATIRSVVGVVAFVWLLVPALLFQQQSTLVMSAAAVLVVGLGLILTAITLFLRRDELPVFVRNWSPRFVLRFIETARAHRLSPRDFAIPALLAFLTHATTASMLYAGLMAIGYPADVSTVLIGYVIGKLFFMMAPIFQGIGVVEIGMALALQQAGLPVAVAVGAAMLYRVGDLWIPLTWAAMLQIARSPVRALAVRVISGANARLRPRLATMSAGRSPTERQLIHLANRALPFEAHVPLTVSLWILLAAGIPLLA